MDPSPDIQRGAVKLPKFMTTFLSSSDHIFGSDRSSRCHNVCLPEPKILGLVDTDIAQDHRVSVSPGRGYEDGLQVQAAGRGHSGWGRGLQGEHLSKYPISADGKIHFLFNTSQQRGLGKGADYPTHTLYEFSKIYLREYFKFETMNMNI